MLGNPEDASHEVTCVLGLHSNDVGLVWFYPHEGHSLTQTVLYKYLVEGAAK